MMLLRSIRLLLVVLVVIIPLASCRDINIQCKTQHHNRHRHHHRFLRGGSYSSGTASSSSSSSSYSRSSSSSYYHDDGASKDDDDVYGCIDDECGHHWSEMGPIERIYASFVGSITGCFFAAVLCSVCCQSSKGVGENNQTQQQDEVEPVQVAATKTYDTFDTNKEDDNKRTPPLSSSLLFDIDKLLEFEKCSRLAKEEVEQAAIPITSSASPPVPSSPMPFSGLYSTSYVDRTSGVPHDATLDLKFTPNKSNNHNGGFHLSGQGQDIDGRTIIEDGHVNQDGTAWWRERTVTKDVGLIVLSRGTFDFSQHTFEGTWLASTLEHGAYITFEAQNQRHCKEFEALVQEAKEVVEQHANATASRITATSIEPPLQMEGMKQQLAPSIMSQPYSGAYTISYVDGTTGVEQRAILHLTFTPNSGGFNISGEGKGADGNTIIEDGHVNYNGMAWWRERTTAERAGIMVLSRGSFDFANRTFCGNWFASTKEEGAYHSFEAIVVSPQLLSSVSKKRLANG